MVAVKIASEQSLSLGPRVSPVNPLMLSPGLSENWRIWSVVGQASATECSMRSRYTRNLT
jgi:hypothetical protein